MRSRGSDADFPLAPVVPGRLAPSAGTPGMPRIRSVDLARLDALMGTQVVVFPGLSLVGDELDLAEGPGIAVATEDDRGRRARAIML